MTPIRLVQIIAHVAMGIVRLSILPSFSTATLPSISMLTHPTGATGYDANDFEVQWRLPWYGTPNGDPSQEGRVFVKPGVECNTLCDDWYLGKDGCKAVQVKKWCM